MTTNATNASDEARIREIIEARAEAVRAKDLDALRAPYAGDAVLFDVVGPLRHEGAASGRERTREWLDLYASEIGYEVRDLTVAASDPVAHCHFLYHVEGTTKDGARVAMWVRATVLFEKVDGNWRITHEHGSVPFDGETGKASLDLKP